MRQDEVVSSHPSESGLVDASTVDPPAPVDGGDSVLSSMGSDTPVPDRSESLADSDRQPAASRVVQLDPATLELARLAATAEAGNGNLVGDFLMALAEDEIALTATFTARQPGYAGWQWSVTLALLSGQDPTISEVVLLPGDGALLAPPWLPWDERIRPGDVGVGDLLPPLTDDQRLAPAYLQSDDPAVEAVARELGIGRVQVLSREGRVDFAERLHDGLFGSSAEMALAAPAHCFTCAFYLPLAGSLGALTGACGNEFSPADGRVVDAGYGCGAHSETVLDMPARSAANDSVIDELSLDVHRRPARRPEVTADGAGTEVPGPEVIEVDAMDSVTDEIADPDLIGAEIPDFDLMDAEPADVERGDEG